jgi:two-component system response regulator NreC
MISKRLKIIIVDDNISFRNAVKLFLQNEMNCEIIGEISDGKEFLKLKNINRADLVLMDIQMPEKDGITATKEWCLLNPRTKVIAITMFTDKAYLLPLIEAGFKGCIYKTNFFSKIRDVFQKVLDSGIYFEQEMPIA